MTKGSIVLGLTGLVRATTQLVSRIALQEKAVTADVPAPNSKEEIFSFDAYTHMALIRVFGLPYTSR